MKNHSSARAQKGKTAYRTPSLFRANKAMATQSAKVRGDFKFTKTARGFFKNKSF